MMIVAAFWKLTFIHSYFPTTHFHMQDFIKGKKNALRVSVFCSTAKLSAGIRSHTPVVT